ncbi:NAD(P)-dependent alcohol dehydrogenase [Alkalicoccus halolimnae]|uniref:NAD(P)-dependent alcohol dehydrogenase n=1 Tax=Alkalicoccus halolimnae TaxID=1667239 RepID=A0A5C7FCA2_9BACI|nr:NAD(P)-dependent alcohol dehydrogenase [Alkalicoccus halolimnae]TXF84668.1 NAD(P)-dependent alcohol dehydrogenase [Alkalicoccus halolimnae]
MKAAVYYRYGSPEELKIKNIQKPVPKEEEVLINVYAASINSWDWDLLQGKPLLSRIGGLRRPRYRILGADAAGIVESTGEKVRQLQPGDRVFGDLSGSGWGGFAEYVTAPEHVLARMPENMSFQEAAALPQAAVLAMQGLRCKRPVEKGEKVLINGAGGGVGTFAVQMAKASGAEVTGVDRAEKLEMLQSIGADHVIDYRLRDYTKEQERYNRIIDITAQRSIIENRNALQAGGIYLMIGGKTAYILQLMMLGAIFSRTTSKTTGLLLHKPNKEDLEHILEFVESGKVTPVIDRQFPLKKTAEAFQYFGKGMHAGKVIIKIRE